MENAKEPLSLTTSPEGKTEAIIAYLTVIGLIIAFVMNNEKNYPFAKYHIKQSLGLVMVGLGLVLISLIPILGWIIYLVGLAVMVYMWVMGLIHAINGRMEPVPLIGRQFEEWFQNF
ncbi:hypothetical protein J0A68_20730 [Algoriphagus sp. H41]|uniref:Chloroplast import component protein (Tic20) n=1 Tax=Algoriphagus oliviformis TaxID=2811231 RepID=A0ABS3C8N4_9BACT|nr:hypothetical protein [Algoriphagus oliviformis]MBN7813393.1 hypothetical protein [Algoriphagus oliviformis]